MMRGQIPNYTLLSIHLNRNKSYFKFTLMLAGDINMNPRPITTIDNEHMWDDVPFRNYNLSID